MTLKARVMDPRAADDISDALKAAAYTPKPDEKPEDFQARLAAPLGYFARYYPEGLRQRVLGPNRKTLVPISRYYPTLTPPVAVDFEPAPPDPWYLDIKQQYFYEHGVVFIPIYLSDRLTQAEFIERYREALKVVRPKDLDAARAKHRTSADAHPDPQTVAATVEEALAVEGVEDTLRSPDFQALITRRATQLADERIANSGKRLVGVVRKNFIRQQTDEVIAQVRRQLRSGLDRTRCYQLLADSIERSGDGQVRPPVAGGSGA